MAGASCASADPGAAKAMQSVNRRTPRPRCDIAPHAHGERPELGEGLEAEVVSVTRTGTDAGAAELVDRPALITWQRRG